MNEDKIREQFRERLQRDRRSVKWFYDVYMKKTKRSYVTIYHQIHGHIKKLSDEVREGIRRYMEDYAGK